MRGPLSRRRRHRRRRLEVRGRAPPPRATRHPGRSAGSAERTTPLEGARRPAACPWTRNGTQREPTNRVSTAYRVRTTATRVRRRSTAHRGARGRTARCCALHPNEIDGQAVSTVRGRAPTEAANRDRDQRRRRT